MGIFKPKDYKIHHIGEYHYAHCTKCRHTTTGHRFKKDAEREAQRHQIAHHGDDK